MKMLGFLRLHLHECGLVEHALAQKQDLQHGLE